MKGLIKLGDHVGDGITGFNGIAVCISEWLNMCRRITVQPMKLMDDGKMQEQHTFDELQLLVVKMGVMKHLGNVPEDESTGGPEIPPVMVKDPRR